jgi:hypothetical protein
MSYSNRSVAIIALLMMSGLSQADEWGDFKGQLIYGGAPPTPVKLKADKDVDVCGKHNLVNESLLVDPKSKGIANVVVYLYLKRSDAKPKVHESYSKTANAEVKFDNKNCAFTPRIALLRTTQKLIIGNSDPIGHNTKMATAKNGEINPIVPAGGSLTKEFKEVERLPCTVQCNIHPWMLGYLVVKDNPYMAVTDKDGKFEIKNLPVGEWTFQFWHEKPGYVQDVVLKKGGKQKWKRGRLEVKIDDDGEDLGVIEVPASVFKDK